MSQRHVTANGFCTYCGASLKVCPECGDWFHAKNKAHILCKPRCRTRKSRRLAIKKLKAKLVESSETTVRERQC